MDLDDVPVSDDAELEHREGVGTDPAHDRRADTVREPDSVDVGVDDVLGIDHVGAELEGRYDDRPVLRGDRLDGVEPVYPLDGVLDGRGHLLGDRIGVGGGVEGCDRNQRELDLGEELNRQRAIGEDSGGQYQDDAQHSHRPAAQREACQKSQRARLPR